MANQNFVGGSLSILRAFGGFLIALGLIFGTAWIFNRNDAHRFADGYRVEGTVERIHEGEPPIVMVTFVDRNGRSQTWHLENMTQSVRETLAEGDEVVAVQMPNSPSRIMLLEQIENRPDDRNGLIMTAVFLLPGLFLVLQRRPYGNQENQQKMATRQHHLASGSLFLFMGLIMLIGFFATAFDANLHWLGKLIFGGFCLLTGSGMALGGLRELWLA
ncbi:phage holin family protein [Candidatus Leptofilum sp.]|uniref:phage holin family protein n=1 Tax=Candidatus Leptofilum sp. TaxID=3241576 RepID=UPI003B5925A7